MDMGIVNAGQLAVYEEIPKDLLNWSKTFCSIAAPTPPSDCWPLPNP